jgi:hypothetical protein
MSGLRTEDRGETFARCHGPFNRGFVHKGHRHWIDHDSVVHEGTVLRVRYRHQKEGRVVDERTYVGPCKFKVAAGIFHEIEVMSEEGEWDCVFLKPAAGSAVSDVYHLEMLD